MTANPLVSIITPSYNQAAYLEQTICSVLAQDYEPIEYLIVDGASGDTSAEIIEAYASRAPERIRWWVSEPDSGQAEAINKGLQRANGEIITWLNSDDIYLPGAVKEAVAFLNARPELGLVFSDAITIDAQGRPINKLTFHSGCGWDLAELMRFHIICQPATFMRRSVLREAGLLDPNYHFMLDHHLWLRMALQAPIAYISSTQTTKGSENHSGYQNSGLWAAARHHAEAKNVAQAQAFGDEILKLLQWLQGNPQFKPWVDRDHQRVYGGAYRLNARYLLDGGLSDVALAAYIKALLYWPRYTLKHWHRILYAIAGFLRIKPATIWFEKIRERKLSAAQTELTAALRAHLRVKTAASPDGTNQLDKTWPGLSLTPEKDEKQAANNL